MMDLDDKQSKLKWFCLRLGALALMAIVVLSVVAGCSTTTRHKILTAIFTGVPPLEDRSTETSSADEQVIADTTSWPKVARMPTFWVHGPFGARQCERCHNLSQSTNFRDDPDQATRDPLTSGSIAFASRLAMPKNELCISCHSSHSASSAKERSLQVHAPVFDGNCTVCHHPHQTQRRFMLLASDNRAVCTRCHDPTEDKVMATHVNESRVDCIECHNAHIGTTPTFLKDKDDEIALLYGRDDL